MSSGATVLTERRLSATTLLDHMLRIPSVSGEESALAGWLCATLSDAGFAVAVDAVGNVIASWGDGDEVVALVGHMDTVAGEIPPRVEGTSLYGRGAVDAKGPLAAAIAAAARQRVHGRFRYVVGALVEEETTSRGAHHIAAMPAPNHLIVLEPSGVDGITIGYRGSIRLRWERSQPAAHSAGPHPSAGDHAIGFVHTLREHARATSGDASPFNRIDVRVLRMEAICDGLHDRAVVDAGIRVPIGCDVPSFLAAVQQASGGGTVEIVAAETPVRTDRRSVLARAFVDAVRETGGHPRFKLKTGTSDLNILAPAWGCPAVAYGPGDSTLDHTPGEHIDVRDLERSVDVLDGVLRRLGET